MATKTKSRKAISRRIKPTVGDVVSRSSPADRREMISAAMNSPAPIAGQMQDIIPMMYEAWGAGFGWQPAITWYQLANMYTSWEYTSDEKLARTLASLPAKLYRYENSQGKNVKPYFAKSLMFQYVQKNWHPDAVARKMQKDHGVKRIEVEDHPFLDLVNNPTPGDVRYNFWRLLCIHLELDGSVGVYKAKPDAFGHPSELHILPATWTGQFKPIPANDGVRIIKGYHLLDQNINTDFTTDEIIWLRYTSLRNPFEGMSALKAQLYSYNMDQYLMQQITAYYKNGAMFSNMFETEQQLTKTQYADIKNQMAGYTGAKNAGQNFLLHSGLKVANAKTETAREAMIDAIEKMARDKMLSSHDISPTKIGLTEHVNRSNSEVADMGFFNEAIKPRAMLITEFFTPLAHSYDENLDFEFDYPHFQDRAQDIQERTSNLAQGATTRNEERVKMGLEPVDGGDVILVSPMLVPLDSVANPPKEEPLPQGKQPPEDGKEPPEGAQGLEKPGVTLPSNKGGPGSGRYPAGSGQQKPISIGHIDEKEVNFYKDSIQKAIEEDSSREGHGDTGKTGFWILKDGSSVPYNKGWSEASKEKEVTSVHSHSSASPNSNDAPFETFSGGDIQAHQWLTEHGKIPTSLVISRDGGMDILRGGNFKKSDFKYDAGQYNERGDYFREHGNSVGYDRENLATIAADRGAIYLTGLSWKSQNKSFRTKLYNTPERKALLWKKFDAEATSYEPLFKRVAVKFFRDACAKVIDKLEANGIKVKSNLGSMNLNSRQRWLGEHKDRLDEFLPKLSDLKSKLKDALKPALLSVLKSAAQNQIHDLAGIAPKKTKDIEAEEEMEFDLNDPRVVKWIGDRLDDTSETTAQTTIDATRASLRTDFENGEPLLKMSEHLREYFTGAETWRANLIARTEATAATTQASLEAVEQMDLGDSVGKGWLTENDPKVREDHAAAGERYSDGYDGDTDNIMGVDDEFVVGSDKMVAPGNGDDADENCNCRCGIFWTVINKGE